jgi:hypothetical protein
MVSFFHQMILKELSSYPARRRLVVGQLVSRLNKGRVIAQG